MRLVLWNCLGGLKHPDKVSYLKSLKPDLLIVPEIREKHIDALKPTSAIWITNNHESKNPKGLGVLSFAGHDLQKLDADIDMELFLPIRTVFEGVPINLLAVWAFHSRCKQGRYKGKLGSYQLKRDAINRYKELFTQPSIVAGDWNLGPTIEPKSFDEITEMFGSSGLSNLYNSFNHLPVDAVAPMTHRHSSGRLHLI
ncbi:MAG: endonuclease/exonuclease/phosphatase family protein, partial [Proteobacteria bacterium]